MIKQCDVGCGKPATTQFRDTAYNTCGDEACRSALQSSYPGEAVLRRMATLPRATAQPARGPVYAALLEHLDHLLDNLLPLASVNGALQILAACRGTIRTLHDLDLIDLAEVETLLDRVHEAYRAHDL